MLATIGILWTQRTYTTPFGGIFPDLLMMILIILSILLLVLSFLKKPSTSPVQSPAEKPHTKHQWFDLGVVGLILLLWVFLLRPVGFVVMSVFGFAGISIFLSRRALTAWIIGKSIVYAFIITYLIVFIFGKLLLVPLPVGTIFD
jgi:hypothetical protein